MCKPDWEELSGDDLVHVLGTLANPHRLRVLATLGRGRRYVSDLARELEISRALLQMHLRKLESAGLVESEIEVSDQGKAMKYYRTTPFSLTITPEVLAAAAATLSDPPPGRKGRTSP